MLSETIKSSLATAIRDFYPKLVGWKSASGGRKYCLVIAKLFVLMILCLPLVNSQASGVGSKFGRMTEPNKCLNREDYCKSILPDPFGKEMYLKSKKGVKGFDSLNMSFVGNWPFGGTCRTVAYDSVRNAVFCGSGGGVYILNFSDSTKPVKLSDKIRTRRIVGGLFYDSGTKRLYVATGDYWGDIKEGELEIWGMDSLSEPVRLGTYKTPMGAYDIAVSGNYTYVVDALGLHIIDVSNPVAPLETGHYDSCRTLCVAISGSYAYVADYRYGRGLQVIDVSNPSAPLETGHYDNTLSSSTGLSVSGSYAYVVDADGLHIIDISNPSNPVKTGYCSTPNATLGVTVSGSYAYVADGNSGLRIINITNPAAPVETGCYDNDTCRPFNVTVSGVYAYVVEDAGLWVIDISNPAVPVEKEWYKTPGFASALAISDSYAYVCNTGVSGFQVIDISNPAVPMEIGHCDSIRGFNMAISGSYAYVGYCDLDIIDISAPVNPVKTGHCNIPGYYTYGLAISGSYAYVTAGDSGLRVIDVSNPATPFEAGHYNTPHKAFDVALSGSYAYVVYDTAGLCVLDISNPVVPIKIGQYNLLGGVDIKISGSYAYITYGGFGLRIMDISNPTAPTETGFCTTDYAYEVMVSDSYAYVADEQSVRIINIANPSAPVEAGHYNTVGYTNGVAVSPPYVYTTNYYAGLQIYEKLSVGVKEVTMRESFNVNLLSNPVVKEIKLQIPSTRELVNFRLIDICGRVVKTFAPVSLSFGNNTINLPVSELPGGMYFLNIKTNKYSKNVKVVKFQ